MKRLAVVLCFALASCGSQSIPLTPEVLSDVTDTIDTGVQHTTDSAVAREHEVHLTLRNRDRQYEKAYEKSGVKIKMMLVDAGNGVKMLVPETLEFREQPRFEQPLPTKPADHPFWGFAERVGLAVADKTLWGYGLHEGFKYLTAKDDQPTFQGDMTFGNYFGKMDGNSQFTGDHTGAPVYFGPFDRVDNSQIENILPATPVVPTEGAVK